LPHHPAELRHDLAAGRFLSERQTRHRDRDQRQRQRRNREHRAVGNRRADARRWSSVQADAASLTNDQMSASLTMLSLGETTACRRLVSYQRLLGFW